MTSPKKRAPIAAVISGTEFQMAVALREALRAMLLEENAVTDIEIEVRDAGVLDDIVVRHEAMRPRMLQVKHAMAGKSSCGTEYLTHMSGNSSILRRINESFSTLTEEFGEPPAMELVTDRPLDSTDPMMGARDQMSALLTPDAMVGGPRSKLGQRRQIWLDHLNCTEDELAALLSNLAIFTGILGRTVQGEIAILAAALGLNADDAAYQRGMDYVRAWIQDRERRRSVGQLASDLRTVLGAADRRALVVVNALDRASPDVDGAWELNWIDLFEGGDADARRALSDHGNWEKRVQPDLIDLRNDLRAAGETALVIRTAARQAVIFLVGFYLRRSAQFEVAFMQRGVLWSSLDVGQETAAVQTQVHQIGKGKETAVVVAVSQDATRAVTTYLEGTDLPIGELLTVSEASGPGQMAVTTPGHAATLAVEIVKAVRQHINTSEPSRIHLFLAGPGALAGLAGHFWNALPPTVVYEHQGLAHYEQTLEVRS